MRAILKLNVDLLWFGGIGTYIRAATETDEQVGDRANDPIRVTGAMLRCKVIGEGANLGMTQRGRVEAAMRGVRLNTDAIDNSAGVNTSDVEVNIKIALSAGDADGRLIARSARQAARRDDRRGRRRLVLRNNYLQTLALSLAQRRGLEDLGFQQRLMQTLEPRGQLDRAVEYLPDDMRDRRAAQARACADAAGARGAARLRQALALRRPARVRACRTIPISAASSRAISRSELVERYPDALEQHRLRREIISTQLTNSMINRGGPVVRGAHRRPDRRVGGDASRRRSS